MHVTMTGYPARAVDLYNALNLSITRDPLSVAALSTHCLANCPILASHSLMAVNYLHTKQQEETEKCLLAAELSDYCTYVTPM